MSHKYKVREDTRVTINLNPKIYHEYRRRKADNGYKITHDVNNYLDVTWFGGGSDNIQDEIEETKKKIEEVSQQKGFLEIRLQDLVKSFEERGKRDVIEKNSYDRFIINANKRLANSEKAGINLDIERIRAVWQRDFFPDFNLSDGDVKKIFHLCKNGKFDFDCWSSLRGGDGFGD